MAPLKRKNSQGDMGKAEPTGPEATTRRATRQTSTAPLQTPAGPEPRRRRQRTNTDEKPVDTLQPLLSGLHHKENLPGPAKASESVKPTRGPRAGAATNPTTAPSAGVNGTAATTTTPASTVQRHRPNGTTKHSPQIIEQHQHKVGQTKPITITTSGPDPSAQAAEPKPPNSKPSIQDRNIDKVLFGNIFFKAWYPSYYSKEVLGDISSPSAPGTVTLPHPGKDDQGHGSKQNGGGGSKGGKGGGRHKDTPILDRLCVCPCCFKYSKELVTWWDHVRMCRASGYMPGRQIYVHPRGQRTVKVPVEGGEGVGLKSSRGRKGSGSGQVKMVEEVVQDRGEWSVWEVDGEKDPLFCQNLSLFAKLFLDNKSVFFDVTGFNYFLLVYTPPPAPDGQPHAQQQQQQRHIVGFFSKEKMSWDNNNLACILIFPPWQRKGLGAILMGVSYEISKREGVLGGPEKPISDLGKRGYRRFWASEIARWLLEREDGEVVDVEMCSQATWIAVEDCLAVLREMDVVEEAGMGPPRSKKKTGDEGEEEVVLEVDVPVEEVPRVKLSKEAIRQWVAKNGISLERTCDPAGFIERYALRPEASIEQDE